MQGEAQLQIMESIMFSMTPEERAKPNIINGSRRKRIAAGSGTQVSDINQLLRQFRQMQKLMKQFGGGGGKRMPRGMRQAMQGMPGMEEFL